ncbi:MAG: RHS repeat-associated core domain-containing protein, partial [Roseiflexaceae bacterium]|nr:RHS repeat-associated core domain-containing protein [Roseiflexaceae bacterium]
VTTRYTQDLASPLSQILSDGTNTYIYGMDRLYGIAGSTRTWYASDALGSVRQTLNDSGSVLATPNYDPYGQVQSGSVGAFGFTGELQQGSSVYLRARWYNADSGGFGSRDSFAGFPEQPYSLHQYQYGYSNSVLNRDPSGKYVSEVNGVDTLEPADYRDITLYLYRAMVSHSQDARVFAMRILNTPNCPASINAIALIALHKVERKLWQHPARNTARWCTPNPLCTHVHIEGFGMRIGLDQHDLKAHALRHLFGVFEQQSTMALPHRWWGEKQCIERNRLHIMWL